MKNSLKHFFIGSLSVAALAFSTGCAVINSHSETKTYGTVVSDESLAQVAVGETTDAWLLATLGKPARREIVDDQTEVFRYSSSQLTKVNSELLFILDTSSRREVKRTVFFECVDGVLSRYWVEETESKKA